MAAETHTKQTSPAVSPHDTTGQTRAWPGGGRLRTRLWSWTRITHTELYRGLCVWCQEGPEGTSQSRSDTTAVTPQVPAGPDLRGATIPDAILKDARTGSAHKDLSFSWDAVSGASSSRLGAGHTNKGETGPAPPGDTGLGLQSSLQLRLGSGRLTDSQKNEDKMMFYSPSGTQDVGLQKWENEFQHRTRCSFSPDLSCTSLHAPSGKSCEIIHNWPKFFLLEQLSRSAFSPNTFRGQMTFGGSTKPKTRPQAHVLLAPQDSQLWVQHTNGYLWTVTQKIQSNALNAQAKWKVKWRKRNMK